MPTPYELLRPVWPQTWNEAAYKSITVVKGSIPKGATPVGYAPGVFIPDTTSQAYLDAMNVQISPIRVNQAGYRPDDVKYIYYVGSATTFQVVKSSDPATVVGTGTFSKSRGSTSSSISIRASNNAATTTGGDTRYTAKGTGPSGTLQEGQLPTGLPENERLRIKVGNDLSADFIISAQTYSMVKDATLKFFGINRSGDSQNWFHKPSHLGDPIPGGWYDCGDHLKEAITQSGTLALLSMLAAIYPDRDTDKYAYNQGNTVNTDGIPDILREAKHGADYFLFAYNKNNQKVDASLHLSVGDFGKDHGWWGSPEYQDPMKADYGGTVSRQALRNDLWSSTAGRIAAGLAFTSVQYRRFDAAYADQALEAAKAFYAYGRAKKNAGSSMAYNGESAYYDDMALGAVALLYATRENAYLQDLAYDKTLGDKASSAFPKGSFPGGWFAHTNPSFFHEDLTNTDWARFESFGLFAFYKLILETEEKSKLYGITSDRVRLQRNVAYSLAMTLGIISKGSETIVLPKSDLGWIPRNGTVSFGSQWFEQFTTKEWVWNRYHFGNIADMMIYSEVMKDLSGLDGLDWKENQVKEAGIRQFDYMLGVNPWDISMIYGIGDKNFAHPHHRAANPEGKNVPGASYKYRPPVGALQGGFTPGATGAYTEHYDDYYHSEICIDGSMIVMVPATILAKDEDLNRPPTVSVEIKYVGYDSAIVVVKQSEFGSSVLNYGSDSLKLDQSVSSSTDGVVHTLVLKPLTHGSTYYFTATSKNARSGNATVRYLVDSTHTPYSFTTLNSPPAAADIQNVKVCNVSADSAEVMWFTPNGEYESKISWDEKLVAPKDMAHSQSGDVSGVPTRFHYMKIGGLKEKTTYYYAVESNGVVRSTDANGQPLQFTTPVEQMDFNIRVSSYTWGGLPALTFNIENNEAKSFDSLEMRVYVRDGADLDKNLGVRFDICQAYDEAGYNLPCEDKTIADQAKKTRPVKLDDTYDPATQTWIWYITMPLGTTMVKPGSRMRYDAMLDTRSPWAPYEDLMNQAPKHKPGPGDWTWASHSRAGGDPADYPGLPTLDKDVMDNMPYDVPINPYVTVYRKGEFIWGYSPSYSEQSTKRANYKITTEFEKPFDVPNGTYLKMDAASSTQYIKGKAFITEAGHVTDIWVSGKRLESLEGVATYNVAGDYWDLEIPVKLSIGPNKVDITLFAGPDTECAPCQEKGGCAFENRNFFVDFSKGNRSAGILRIADSQDKPVASPAKPGETAFHIFVTDKDNSGEGSVWAYVINPRKLDTLKVLLKEGDKGSFKTSDLIQALPKDAASTTGNEISFFGGDTLIVRYTDSGDEDDLHELTIFAAPSYPLPQYALAKDVNCDGSPDALEVFFSNAFGPSDVFDSLWVSMSHPATQSGDSFKVAVPQPISGKTSVLVPLPARSSIPATAAPTGYVTAYIKAEGMKERQLENATLRDGIAPTLLGVALLENPEPRSLQDTLKVSFTEPVSLAALDSWPLQVVDGSGAAVDLTGIKVVGKASTTDNGRSWLYVLEGNTSGTLIKDGYTASVRTDFAITDLALNALDPVGGCKLETRIIETPKPVPVNAATIIDSTGDGYADAITLQFVKKLRPKDMLDSFRVEWGNPAIIRNYLPTDWSLGEAYGSHTEMQPDSSALTIADTFSVITVHIPLSRRFPFGTTHGAQNGYGAVMPRLGPEGGFFDKSYPVADLCPPVILSARKSRSMDSVGVVLSEPVDTLAGGYFLERRRDSVAFVPSRMIAASNGTQWVFTYNDQSQGALRVGDWIRLSPLASSKTRDKALNLPTTSNPWTELKGSLAEKVRFEVTNLNPIGGTLKSALGGTPYDGHWPIAGEQFRINVLDPRSGHEVRLASGTSKLKGTDRLDVYDTSVYRHLGPTFRIDVIMPSALIEQSGLSAWDFNISMDLGLYDNLGQYVNTTRYAFTLSQLGRDLLSDDGTLTFLLEWTVPNGKGSPLSTSNRAVGSGAYIAAFDFTALATYQISAPEATPSTTKAAEPEYKRGDRIKVSDSDRITFGVLRP